MTYRILLVGGGSGGHIYPLISVSKELQKIASEKEVNLELLAVADNNNWREEFNNVGIKFKSILAPKLRQVEGGRINFIAFLKIPIALIQSLWILFVFMPDAVFSKGGFASVIPSLVARLYFTPIFIHESDSVPGMTNRFLAKFAKKIFISFENSAVYFSAKGGSAAGGKNKVVLSGNPIRENLLNGDKNQAAAYFNLNPGLKTILFLAGSQGAVFINNLLINGLVQLVKDFQIIHQTGAKNFNSVNQEVDRIKKEGSASYGNDIEKKYRIFGFLKEEELRNAFAMGDVVVARGGSSIFEISAVGRPAIVIPYPYSAHNHQKENAREFAKFGAVVLDEGNLKPHILIDQIKHLLNSANYSSVGQRIRQFANLESGKIIAREISSHVFRK